MGLREAERIVAPSIPNEDVTLKQVRDYCRALLAGLDAESDEDSLEVAKRCGGCRFSGVCLETADQWSLDEITLTPNEIHMCRLFGTSWIGREESKIKLFDQVPDWGGQTFRTKALASISDEFFPSAKFLENGTSRYIKYES